jgi:hypothetical protein
MRGVIMTIRSAPGPGRAGAEQSAPSLASSVFTERERLTPFRAYSPAIPQTGVQVSYALREYVTLNLGFNPGHGCAGTIGFSSEGSFKLVVTGKTIYFDPPAQFWKSLGVPDASAIIARVDGRYIKTSASVSGMAPLASTCDLSQQVASAKVTGTLIKGRLTTLGGARVLPIVNPQEGVLYVTDTSKPEIAEIINPKSIGGGTHKVILSVGAPVTLTAPPASQVINGSAIGM